MAVTEIIQCEGCSQPLASMMAAYERGEVSVTWRDCERHAAGTNEQAPMIASWVYDYPEDEYSDAAW